MKQRRHLLCHALTTPLIMVVPPDGATVAYKILRTSMREEMSWTPLVSSPMTLGWKNTRATETFSTDSADVSVWELVLDLHRGWGQRRQFVRHALNNLSGHDRDA